jgi:NDP-sugar pyrophosphorylase family protein
MINEKYALILAAGRGMRMMPLTASIPKPMAMVWGTTLLELAINRMKSHINNIHVTVGYKGALLADHAISLGVSGIINTSNRGNCWWIFNSLFKNVDSPVFVQTCDNIASINYSELEEEYFDLGSPPCMLVPVKPITGYDGDFITQDANFVLSMNRSKPTDLYCSGVQILNPSLIFKEYYPVEDFSLLWAQMIARGSLMCSHLRAENWFALDTLEQLLRVDSLKNIK